MPCQQSDQTQRRQAGSLPSQQPEIRAAAALGADFEQTAGTGERHHIFGIVKQEQLQTCFAYNPFRINTLLAQKLGNGDQWTNAYLAFSDYAFLR